MKKLWLVTGAAGHIGTVLVAALLARGEEMRALVLPESRALLPPGVDVCEGDVRDPGTLAPFFARQGYDRASLIHCAARITIASKPDPELWDVNVTGTEHVLRAAKEAGVDRVIYVSSVHAIPEKAPGETITEVSSFSPDVVRGQYARSKAAAAQLALQYAASGLNVSIVHPSGVIGPGDVCCRNHMIRTIRAMDEGKIPIGVQGGYDFVDARDVAEGILGCEEHGLPGECYILSGHYISIPDLLNMVRKNRGKRPIGIALPPVLARALAPVAEQAARIFGKDAPILTPYSIYTLHTGSRFSHEKATKAFAYRTRKPEESVRDSL